MLDIAVVLPYCSELERASTAVLCVDLQHCYYSHPVPALFPGLERAVTRVLAHARQHRVLVTQVRATVFSLQGWTDPCNHSVHRSKF